MTLDLDPIKARAHAASPGPWADGAIELDLPSFVMSPRTCAGCGEDWPLAAPDAEFIAHAREDVPALLAEVERLRGIIDAANHATDSYNSREAGGWRTVVDRVQDALAPGVTR